MRQSTRQGCAPVRAWIGKAMLLLTSFATAVSTMAGNVCTWQGGSGSLSDDNWDVKPVSGNGDTLVFDTTDGNAITISNETEDFKVAKVEFKSATLSSKDEIAADANPGAVTFEGKRIYVAGSTAAGTAVWYHGGSSSEWERGPAVIVNTPIRFAGGNVQVSRTVTFNGDVQIDDSGSLRFVWPRDYSDNGTYDSNTQRPWIVFNGEVYGPNATLDNSAGNGGRGSRVTYNGKVTVKSFLVCKGANARTHVHLAHPGNDIPTMSFTYAYVYLDSANVFSEATVIEHADDRWGPGRLTVSADQSLRAFTKGSRSADHKSLSVTTPSGVSPTLTMKPTESTAFDGGFHGGLSLVYDPMDNVTYTLDGAASTLTGKVVLKRGCLALKGGTAAFTKATAVQIWKNARLDLSESTATASIASSSDLDIALGGKIVIPEGMQVSVKSITYGGIPLAADTYSGVGWIEGEGCVVSSASAPSGETHWTVNGTGNWSDSGKWTDGCPSSVNTGYIKAEQAVVTADLDRYSFGRVHVGGGLAPAKVLVSKDALFADGSAFTIEDNGVFEQTAGEVTISNKNNDIIVDNGGVWRVSGGTNTIVSSANTYLSARTGGEIQVSGGRLNLANTGDYVSSFSLNGGKLVVSGDGYVDIYNSGNPKGNGQLEHGTGEVLVKDNATFYSRASGNCTKFTYKTEGNSMFDVEDAILSGYKKGADVAFDFGSSNRQNRCARSNFGVNYTCRSDAKIRKSAYMMLDIFCRVGSVYAKYGFQFKDTERKPVGMLSIDGTVVMNSHYLGEANELIGLIVGSTECSSAIDYSRTAAWPTGVVNIGSDGSVTNLCGFITAGVGYGDGAINVSGGRLLQTGSGHLLIGDGEGVGSLRITDGGLVKVTSSGVGGYVGGFAQADIGKTLDARYPSDSTASTGRVEVVDGTLDFGSNSLVFGSKGAAVLEVGTNATFKAKNLTLNDNRLTEVRFMAGAEGFRPVELSGKLTIADGVKLVVDFCGTMPKDRKLFGFTSCEGDFDAENVRFLNLPESAVGAKVVKTPAGIKVSGLRGMVLLYR